MLGLIAAPTQGATPAVRLIQLRLLRSPAVELVQPVIHLADRLRSSRMDLREAYVELELPIGATEDEVREARKLLAKVWHPDRHANDPKLQKKAEAKLADINTAYELIRAASYPSSIPDPKPKPKPAPKPTPKPAPGPAPRAAPPPVQSQTEFVPTRRVRWSVVLVLFAAIGVGTYLAIVKLGSKSTPNESTHVPVVTDPPVAPDAAIAIVTSPDTTPDEPKPAPTAGKTFGLGATPEQVRAAQGEPSDIAELLGIWHYGFSTVTFKRGKVVGWWDIDDVLRTQLEPADPQAAAAAKASGGLEIGATKDQVIGVQGTPNRIEHVIDETWYYGRASNVVFDGSGKVKGWHNDNGELQLHR
jgi:hypothetical protein